MKNTLYTVLTVLLMLIGSTAAKAQTINRLEIPDISGECGQQIVIPVNLENTDEITALEFNISFRGRTLEGGELTLTDRATDHIARFSGTKVMVYSPTNAPFKGNDGNVLKINFTIPDGLDYGGEYSFSLSEVILATADGTNVRTSSKSGKLTITSGPDFTITDVQPDKTAYAPQGQVILSYVVSNIGTRANMSGWSEIFELVSDTRDQTTYLDQYYNTYILEPGESASRSVSFVLPKNMYLDGDARFRIKLSPSSGHGEGVEQSGNNVAESATVSISKALYINPGNLREEESYGSYFYLSRSGNTDNATTYELNLSDPTRARVQETITIPAGNSGVGFYVYPIDNDLAEGTVEMQITAAGDGMVASANFYIYDDDHSYLTLSSSATEITEGDKFTLNVGTDRTVDRDVTVRLWCNHDAHFTFPSEVVIPSGQYSATVEVTAIDDDTASETLVCDFGAIANGHINYPTVTITVKDNDTPELSLELTPTTVNENDGLTSVSAVIRRTGKLDNAVTILLSDDSKGDIFYPTNYIFLAKGAEEAYVTLGIIDNTQVDGDRDVTVTAAVQLRSCNCSTETQQPGSASAILHILDNDGPALSLSAPNPTINEGGEFELVVTRNTDPNEVLTVTLSCDSEGFTFPSTVTFAAGESAVSVSVSVASNNVEGDNRTAVFTASAEGYASSACHVLVTDHTLPDGAITALRLTGADSFTVGDEANVEVTIANRGIATLPAGSIDVKTGSGKATTLYFHDPLAPGEEITVSRKITLPMTVGSCRITATYNDSRAVKELSYTNNSLIKEINLQPLFSATVTTDKAVYTRGETIIMRGNATGRDIAGKTVEIFLINNGVRRTVEAVIAADGTFEATYTPTDRATGTYIAGACYPGENISTGSTDFDITGLVRADYGQLTSEGIVGKPYNMEVMLVNNGRIAAEGISVELGDIPANYEVEVDVPTTIAADSRGTARFTLTANAPTEGSLWQKIPVTISQSTGAKIEFTLDTYARYESGALSTDMGSIEGTMTKGATREFPVTITNTGAGATGAISVVLPTVAWMRSATPLNMASLEPGESTTLVLSLTPTESMQLNVPQTGTIGINCANGTGLALPYSFEPVSEVTGTLAVDVCDEYTYYTAEAPHVAGATVTLMHPVTGAVVAQGVTGEDGIFNAEVPEGYYTLTVTHDTHSSYTETAVLVNPGRVTDKTVVIPFNAIQISYEIVETEIEDEYLLVTNVTYETNVPKPVVTIEGPSEVVGDDMAPGDSKIVNIVVTNHGLITALNNVVTMPEDDAEWTFEALTDLAPFDLAPQQARIIPVMITRKAAVARANNFNEENPLGRCMAFYSDWYEWHCGDSMLDNEGAYKMALKACAYGILGQAIMDAMSGIPSMGQPNTNTNHPGTSGPGRNDNRRYGSEQHDGVLTETKPAICDPEMAGRGNDLLDDLLGRVPGVGPLLNVFNNTLYYCDKPTPENFANMVGSVLEPATDFIDDQIGDAMNDMLGSVPHGDAISAAGQVAEGLNNWFELGDNLGVRDEIRRRAAAALPDFCKVFDASARRYCDLLYYYDRLVMSLVGNPIWFDEYDAEMDAFFSNVKAVLAEKGEVNLDDVIASKPSVVSQTQLEELLERINTGGSSVDSDYVRGLIGKMHPIEDEAISKGYESAQALFNDDYEAYAKELRKESQSVCASVSLQFSQSMYMSRQAFRGTLSVLNGHDSKAMSDIHLDLKVTDSKGVPADSDRFQISLESIDGFGGEGNLNAGWSLDSKASGVATVLYIPTKNAAPEEPQAYNFSGSITYLDPYTDLEVTRELKPVTLTVKPSPELDLVYFMQRDVFGDDPLTPDVIEPSADTEFALLIVNKGAGDASNVRMSTRQPEIVDNEKGLAVDFEMVSSQLNGADKTLALGQTVATEFGAIAAGQTAYAQWWLRCSLLGHFTAYDVTATHVTDHGNPDLSLLDEVSIHELIHSIDLTTTDNSKGWIVNDEIDSEDMPDTIWFSDGTTDTVGTAVGSASMTSDNECTVNISVRQAGWFYLSVNDPAVGRREIEAVSFNGVDRPINNAWLTDRTLRDGHDPLTDYRIHLAGYAEEPGMHSFVVRFAPTPETTLEVNDFTGVPEGVATEAVKTVCIVFSKPVEEATFTADDIELRLQGSRVAVDNIGISRVSDTDYRLDLSGLTDEDGYYVLTVATDGIIDSEGFHGKNAFSTSWVQALDHTTTGTETLGLAGVALYPVPATDVLNIRTDSTGNFSILDMAGVTVASGRLDASGLTRVDVGALASGTYIVIVDNKALRMIKL